MKYDNVRAFEKHLVGAAPDHFASVYVILGEDYNEVREGSELLLRYLLPKGREMGLTVLEQGAGVMMELGSMTFFSEKRVVWVQQADKLKKEVQEALEVYLDHPRRDVFLLLTAASLHKGTNFYKKCEKAGVVLEIVELKPWEQEKRAVEWLGKRAVESRKVMGHAVSQSLVRLVGTDQMLLGQEFEKLLCYVGERKEISLQDVGAVCSVLNVETVWQLGESLFNFNSVQAVHICQGMMKEGSALLPLLRQLRSQFQTGYQIGTIMASGGGASEVVKDYPYMRGQILEKNMTQAQHYGLERYHRGLLALDEAEMQLKQSLMEDELLAELLMIRLSTK